MSASTLLLAALGLAGLGAGVAHALAPSARRRVLACVVVGAAPLLGIGTTVVGLVRAFGAVAEVNPADKAHVLSEGISKAMVPTAMGVVLGIAVGLCLLIGERRMKRAPGQGTSIKTG